MKRKEITAQMVEFTADKGKFVKYNDSFSRIIVVNKSFENEVTEVLESEAQIAEEMYTKQEYDNEVNALIRRKYSESEEFAILRQRDTKIQEFEQYNEYCEQCKIDARTSIVERKNAEKEEMRLMAEQADLVG